MHISETDTKAIIDGIDDGKIIDFIRSCKVTSSDFALFPGGKVSPIARCLAVYNLHMLQARDEINRYYTQLVHALYQDLHDAYLTAKKDELLKNTKYLQLLTFTLRALNILGALSASKLEKYIPDISTDHIKNELVEMGVFQGKEYTGNTAMFYAILLLFREAYLDDTDSGAMRAWIKLHLDSMNRFGFWGPDRHYTYQHFYNGYHQYEIFEYLKLKHVYADKTVKLVASLQDKDGHFAPSPGGAGCYDYDAIFMLTPGGSAAPGYESVLRKAAVAIKLTQNEDGGFAGSRMPNAWGIRKIITHISSSRSLMIAKQRAGSSLRVVRKKIKQTSDNPVLKDGSFSQSNLWDTWFRLMGLARIDHALHVISCKNWGFINFPGIGYHPSLNIRGGYYH